MDNSKKHYLYRHFDQKDRLLYVGVSISSVARLGQHRYQSHWSQKIQRVEIQEFTNKQEALQAERKAIQTELPLFNRQYAKVLYGVEPETGEPYFLIDRDFFWECLIGKTLSERRKVYRLLEGKLQDYLEVAKEAP